MISEIRYGLPGTSSSAYPGVSPEATPPLSFKETDKDELILSARPDSIRALGLHPRSLISLTAEQVDFHLSFTASAAESLTASGRYQRVERSLDLSLAYSFTRMVEIDGVRQERRFDMQVRISARDLRESSLEAFREPEDILHFLRRVVDDIFDVSQDDSKYLTGVVFDLKDVAELAGLERGRLLAMLHQFVRMVQYLAQLKDLSSGNEEKREPVLLQPKRMEFSGVEAGASYQQELEIQLSVQEAES